MQPLQLHWQDDDTSRQRCPKTLQIMSFTAASLFQFFRCMNEYVGARTTMLAKREDAHH